MAVSLGGFPVITSPSDPRLRTGTIPFTRYKLTCHRAALPLFLHLFATLNRHVKPLSWDTWSWNPRKARLSAGWSDHAAGRACDAWSGTIGSMASPTRMTATQAAAMSKVLRNYRTADGRYVFLWGTSKRNPGVDYPLTYGHTSDPMHVAQAPGITDADLAAVAKRLGIGPDGRAS